MKRLVNILKPVIFVLAGFISACSHISHTDSAKSDSSGYANYPEGGGLYVSATFGKEGRLWRVVPEKNNIYVDFSDDLGKTFNAPIRVNREEQKIKVSGENRPGILVDNSGSVFVIYTAEANQPITLFYSVSSDNGSHFSAPKPVSDKAEEANTFQGKLGIDSSDKVYAFWHDERTRTDWRQPGNAIYSAKIDAKNGSVSGASKLSDTLCDCCRIAVAFNKNNEPVLLTRFVYPGNVRDHGIVKGDAKLSTTQSWRVTNDNWTIEACPEHGPALAIGNDGQYHVAWFTQGNIRQGLFYAHSKDQGHHFSNPKAVGTPTRLPSHPDIMVLGNNLFLTWIEFDGQKTLLFVQQSQDGGETWLPPKMISSIASDADYPFLLTNKGKVFVSWNSKKEGYRLLPLN